MTSSGAMGTAGTVRSVGVVGLGGAGRAHVRRLRRIAPGVELHGFDPSSPAAAGTRRHDRLDSLLEAVDAVSVCSPDGRHAADAIAALEAGKPVLVEKPMASSSAEAEELGRVHARHPALALAVHHQMRFVPAFEQAKRLIDAGRLGALHYLEANYWHDMRERSTRFDDWRVRGKGQSVIFGAACHPVDLLLHLAGEEVAGQTTTLNKTGFREYPQPYTAATTVLRFRSGLVAKSHSTISSVFPQRNDLVVLGDRASYVDGVLFPATDGRPEVWPGTPKARLVRWLARSPAFRANPFSAYDHEAACERILRNFLAAAAGAERPLVGYDQGLRIVRLCEEMEASGLAAIAASASQ